MMLSLALFFLMLSSGSVYMTARYGRKYEETVPLTMFCMVEIVFLFGLIDNLKLGFWVVCVLSLLCMGMGIREVVRKNSLREFCGNLLSPAFFIFAALLAVYAVCMVGRVAWRGDEFSFWATSVKKMWYLNALPCVPEANPYFTEYPPGMQIFQYILQALHGSFSEWRISAAYMIYVFALFLPFLRGLQHKCVVKNLLIFVVVFTCGTIIYPNALDNLMVDFALGATFAYGMAMAFSMRQENGEYNRFSAFHMIMAANMLILIKSAGKLFAVIVLIAWVIIFLLSACKNHLPKSSSNKKGFLLDIGSMFIPLATALLWRAKYSYYETHVAFEQGGYDLKEFFSILIGRGEGYRTQILSNFISFLTSQRIQIGFLSLTNIQLALVLFALLFAIWYCVRKKVDSGSSAVTAYIVIFALPVYWLGLLASYMYTFSEGEGVALASMQRYLNIYFVGILLMVIFLLLYGICLLQWSTPAACSILLLVLCFISYDDVLLLASRQNVAASIAQREPFQNLADQIYADQTPKIEESSNSVLLIHREGYPHIPVNHFTYLLWPAYQVPWECSYGTPLFEGDAYTQNLTTIELQDHVLDLGIDYIAVEYLDEDFITTYQSLFDSPLENGQVYRVSEGAEQFELLTTKEG